MSDTLPTSLLATCLRDIAEQLGRRLPAAFDLASGAPVLDGDAAAHAMPARSAAVRWELEGLEAALVVALTDDAAALLVSESGEDDVAAVLTARIADLVPALAPLFDGDVPRLSGGVLVSAGEALATGPGDGVSVPLIDGGTHRATVGLRMVVGDHLLEPTGAAAPQTPTAPPTADASGAAGVVGPAGTATIGLPKAAHGVAAGQVGLHAAAPGIVGAAPPQAPTGRPQPRSVGAEQPQAHPAEFASFDQLSALPGAARSMAMLGDVEMGVTAELGRTRLTVRDVLGLTPGSIIELDRAAGSPVDVVVNGTLIARGEVVVIDEEFGIRVTEIIGMAEEASPFPLQVAQ